MRILALDLSKRSTGWACFSEEDSKPSYGHWVLGSEYTSLGKTFLKLHQSMHDLHGLGPITHIYYEDSLMQSAVAGHSSVSTVRVLSGLCMHVESYGEAIGARQIVAVNMATWRKHFIGSKRRGTKRVDLKAMVMDRCRELGFRPRNDDEADALGILDYAYLAVTGNAPPWAKGELFPAALANNKQMEDV